ncbi:MAG: transposase [Deltaproteobacteria bacterium]|nr:transposase [Deltaproteobacteria bacterium]
MRAHVSKKKQSKRRTFTAEYKAQVVALCKQPGKTAYIVGKGLDIPPSAVARSLTQAEIDPGRGEPGALTTAEREELAALRRENRSLRQERDILRKATAISRRRACRDRWHAPHCRRGERFGVLVIGSSSIRLDTLECARRPSAVARVSGVLDSYGCGAIDAARRSRALSLCLGTRYR